MVYLLIQNNIIQILDQTQEMVISESQRDDCESYNLNLYLWEKNLLDIFFGISQVSFRMALIIVSTNASNNSSGSSKSVQSSGEPFIIWLRKNTKN